MVDTCIVVGIHIRESSPKAKFTASAQLTESSSYNAAFGIVRKKARAKFSRSGPMEESTLVVKRTTCGTAGVC